MWPWRWALWALWALGALAAGGAARELAPAACAARFRVQADKIIRTEESRGLGARYLAELDVGARQECRRLCCETERCDVFVYEEKSPGSCYLFACGPPEDFRCKFTAHGNFTSGVLAAPRRLLELPPPPAPPAPPPAAPAAPAPPAPRPPAAPAPAPVLYQVAPPTSPAPPPTATTPAPAPAPTAPPPTSRRCSRYQFECHSGGECVAVYNACDGVPQCADGSDEAPELGCPAPPPPPPPPPPLHVSVENDDEEKLAAEAEAEVEAEAGGRGAAGERWPPRLAQAQPRHRYHADSYGEAASQGAAGAPGGAGAAGGSHIFSHTGGLVQGAPYDPPWPHHNKPWTPRNELDAMPVWSVEGEDGGAGEWGGGGGGGGGGRAWPVPPRAPPAPAAAPQMPLYLGPKTMPEVPLLYGGGEQAALRDAAKKAPPELPLPELPPPARPPLPPAPPAPPALRHDDVKKPEPPKESRVQEAAPAGGAGLAGGAGVAGRAGGAGVAGRAGGAAPARAHFAAEEEHDGLSDHPPSAIFLLVLGVVMTVVVGAGGAARVRAARRRRRRAPLAHDADYLVNGMYL